MKRLLSILLTAILCSTAASAQTIRTLGYNSTNGQVIANAGTNLLTFTNTAVFSAANNDADVILEECYTATNKEVGIHLANQEIIAGGNAVLSWTTNEIAFYQPMQFYDNSAGQTRTNLGLGTTNIVRFGQIYLGGSDGISNSVQWGIADDGVLTIYGHSPTNADLVEIIDYFGGDIARNIRKGFGLSLSSLTNTSNVTLMRALSGSTNTNHPFSGTVSVIGTNNTNTLVFSNGILQSVQ